MNYNEFKQANAGKSIEEILNFIRKSDFDGKKTYYNTYTIFTADGVAIAQEGEANNAAAPLRLKKAAYEFSAEAKKSQENFAKIREEKNELAKDFDLEKVKNSQIWGNDIFSAEKVGEAIKITLATKSGKKSAKTYTFLDLGKLAKLTYAK